MRVVQGDVSVVRVMGRKSVGTASAGSTGVGTAVGGAGDLCELRVDNDCWSARRGAEARVIQPEKAEKASGAARQLDILYGWARVDNQGAEAPLE